MLDLELVEPARAAARAEPAQLIGMFRVGHVPHLEAAEEARVGAGAAAHLDPRDRDVVPGERAVARGVHHDVLRGGPRRVAQPRDLLRHRRVARVDHRHAVELVGRTEALVAARVPVREAPGADVCVALVHPDVGVEAAPADRVVADDREPGGRTRGLRAAERLDRRLRRASERAGGAQVRVRRRDRPQHRQQRRRQDQPPLHLLPLRVRPPAAAIITHRSRPSQLSRAASSARPGRDAQAVPHDAAQPVHGERSGRRGAPSARR